MSSAAVSYLQADASYRRDPSYAQSHVKHILKSPAHFRAAQKHPLAPTLKMQMGSGFHCLALEGEEQFLKDFICKPEGLSLATVKGKEWKEANKGKTVLSANDTYHSWEAVYGMTDSLRRLDWFDPLQPDYRKFNEVSLYWEQDGVPCKGRIDRLLLLDDKAIVLDLKSTESIDFSSFSRKIFGDMNYLFQAGWYTEGVQAVYKLPTSFYFVAVETAAPYALAVFEVSAPMMEEALGQTERARSLLKQCLATNDWHPPEVQFHTLELPSWYRSPLDTPILGESDPDLDAAFADFHDVLF